MDAIPTRCTRLAGVERSQQDLSRLLALLAEVVEGHKLTNRDDAALVQLPADAMKAVR